MITNKDKQEIATAILCGQSYVEVKGIRVPLNRYELNPRLTRKQKETTAEEYANNITKELMRPL